MRTHLKIFYDELWVEHIRLSSGKIVKPFKDRHEFGKMSLSDGFKKEKPRWFFNVDTEFQDTFNSNYIISLADNRMKMGDFRYGRITRESLNNYDVIKEFWKRRKIAYETSNLEYIVDMYNMIRIQAHKDNYIKLDLWLVFRRDYKTSILENWSLLSIDDGIHAEEK